MFKKLLYSFSSRERAFNVEAIDQNSIKRILSPINRVTENAHKVKRETMNFKQTVEAINTLNKNDSAEGTIKSIMKIELINMNEIII